MTLHTVPFEMGFAPTPWEPMTDFELLKKLGVFDVELMRTIELMAAQYNMNNKRLGQIAMQHAEKYNLLPKEQYGSRKRHRSITCLLNKVLLCEISRQLCLPLASPDQQRRSQMLRLHDPQCDQLVHPSGGNSTPTHHGHVHTSAKCPTLRADSLRKIETILRGPKKTTEK